MQTKAQMKTIKLGDVIKKLQNTNMDERPEGKPANRSMLFHTIALQSEP